MKKVFESVMEWKTSAAFMFSGSVILYGIISLLLGKREISLAILGSLMILSVAGSFLQFIAFSGRIIKHMRYSLRMILFAIPFLAMLACSALAFQWFPKENIGAWMSFIAIFIIVFIGMSIGYEIYYRVMGRKYDGLLGQYRKQNEQG
ncbi:MAG: hypothetical protein LBU32_18090 [Clostridiales bacterium]|jgi:hypothetical protein|nr:hypothetical protein [Clostridiales bacterium]